MVPRFQRLLTWLLRNIVYPLYLIIVYFTISKFQCAVVSWQDVRHVRIQDSFAMNAPKGKLLMLTIPNVDVRNLNIIVLTMSKFKVRSEKYVPHAYWSNGRILKDIHYIHIWPNWCFRRVLPVLWWRLWDCPCEWVNANDRVYWCMLGMHPTINLLGIPWYGYPLAYMMVVRHVFNVQFITQVLYIY